MNDIIQILGIAAIAFLMWQAWRYLFSTKVYLTETKIFRATWFMVLSVIIALAIW